MLFFFGVSMLAMQGPDCLAFEMGAGSSIAALMSANPLARNTMVPSGRTATYVPSSRTDTVTA